MANKKFIQKYSEALIQYRIFILALSVILVALIGSYASNVTFDANYRIWFEKDDPFLMNYDRFTNEFGNDDMFVVGFKDEEGIINPKPLDTIKRLTEKFWKVTGVIRVDSITNYQATQAVADGLKVEALFPDSKVITDSLLKRANKYLESAPLVVGSLITEDKKVAVIRAKFAPTAMNARLPGQVYKEVQEILTKEKEISGYSFYTAGGPLTDQAFDMVAQSDAAKLVPLVFVLLMFVLWMVLRSFRIMALPILIAVFAVVVTMGITGVMGYKLNTITASITHIILGIAVATTIHMVTSFMNWKSKGLDSKEAVISAIHSNIVPIIITSCTTAVGFYSFLLASIVPIKRLGFMAGTGALIIMIFTLTILPAMLSYVPNRKLAKLSLLERYSMRKKLELLASLVMNHSGKIIVFWLILITIFLSNATNLVVDSDPSGYFKSDYWFSKSIDFLETEGSGGAVYEIVARGKGAESVKTVAYMRDLDKFSEYLKNSAPGNFANVYSLSEIVKEVNRSLHNDEEAYYLLPETDEAIAQYILLYTLSVPVGQDINDRINVDYSASRITVIRPLVSTRDSQKNIDVINAWANKNLKNIEIEFTGRDVLYTNMGNNVSSSLIRSLAFAVLVVTLIIMTVFRSIKITLISVVANVLPLGIVLGFMGLSNIMLDIGTIMVASVGFGIIVDDTIHFLSHYTRHRASNMGVKKAISSTLADVGAPIGITTCALILAFLIFMTGSFMPNFYFGLLLGIVLFVALVADLTLLPALTYFLGRKSESYKQGNVDEIEGVEVVEAAK